jgi:opacity protein-like surface antigen
MRRFTTALAFAATILASSLAMAQSASTTPTQPTTTAPVAGSNSFTEGQARSRIEAAGFTDVTDLQKDDQGVWRGRAMRNGTAAAVGLDFRGNVVEGAAPATNR